MAVQPLNRDASQPLWRQLQSQLLERVKTGEFAEHFPGEFALVTEYGVSRHTVRQALQQLRDDGVIVSERGRQPRVAPAPEIQQPMGALYSLFASVETAGLAQRSIVKLRDIRADGLVSERLQLEASTPLLYLERLRLAGDAPLAIDRVWLPANIAKPLATADFTHTSLYAELADRTGIRLEHGTEDIHAVIPTAAERKQLDCGPETAAFSINRLGYWQDQPVEWRHTIVRGDRFALTAEFSAASGYRLMPDTHPSSAGT